MEPSATHSKSNVWLLLFLLSTVGLIIFATLFFSRPMPPPGETRVVVQAVTNTVMNTVTNEVIRVVPKEVEKIVKVPVELPSIIIAASNMLYNMLGAEFVGKDKVLFRMTNIAVQCFLNDDIKKYVSEDEVRSKFELTLRRNNVPIDSSSPNVVSVSLDGFFTDQTQLLSYMTGCRVFEIQWVSRGEEWHKALVTVWQKAESYGNVGRNRANAVLLGDVERFAELFANDFLSANPKKQ
jgi:hypothetical protein